MDQMQMLGNYQLADMAADRFEREMKRSPNRQKLVKHRDFLLSQQEAMHKIEGDIEAMRERMEGIRDDVIRLEEELKDLQETLSEEEPENLDITRRSLQSAQQLVGAITRSEQELSKIRKDAETRDRQQHEVRVRAAKVRAEFDALKAVYDKEYKEQTAELAGLRAIAAKQAEGIDPALMEKYKGIKQHQAQPIAKLVDGNRCGGCNMNLPQVVLREIRTGAKNVECENCGRIVLVEDA